MDEIDIVCMAVVHALVRSSLVAPAVPSGSRAGGALHIQASRILGGILPAGTQTIDAVQASHGRAWLSAVRIQQSAPRGDDGEGWYRSGVVVGWVREDPARPRRGAEGGRGGVLVDRAPGGVSGGRKNVALMSRLRKRQRSPDSPISLQLLSGFPSERGSTHETPNPLPRRADQMEIEIEIEIEMR